ncbi:diphthine synthase [Candidatus Woesearchaeota archaeon]|jgi:diphthine synthase|nr:diphthine synthase [Candidatus Woesearchaeota archaeon]MBT7062391.1 diphthine synthase [Candidatus Woesearchaeota archaeon]MBT7402548.1 diphthine synthase [Candidatus Woesearchaeota archaeon]
MLYLVSLGLSFKDLSVRSLEVLKKCSEVYLENYTSASDFSLKQLEKLIGKKVVVLNRDHVEIVKPFFNNAKTRNIALLVYGDALSATTHTEILQSAKKKKIKVEILHGPSILTAIADTGLSLYKFGKAASVPFWQNNFKPESFFDILEENQKIQAHTLFLLDLRPELNKFMTVKEAIDVLIKIARKRKSKVFTNSTFCIGCSQLGTSEQIIKSGAAKELMSKRFGTPACLIIPGKLADYEMEALK